jgi:hypothetical protein
MADVRTAKIASVVDGRFYICDVTGEPFRVVFGDKRGTVAAFNVVDDGESFGKCIALAPFYEPLAVSELVRRLTGGSSVE